MENNSTVFVDRQIVSATIEWFRLAVLVSLVYLSLFGSYPLWAQLLIGAWALFSASRIAHKVAQFKEYSPEGTPLWMRLRWMYVEGRHPLEFSPQYHRRLRDIAQEKELLKQEQELEQKQWRKKEARRQRELELKLKWQRDVEDRRHRNKVSLLERARELCLGDLYYNRMVQLLDEDKFEEARSFLAFGRDLQVVLVDLKNTGDSEVVRAGYQIIHESTDNVVALHKIRDLITRSRHRAQLLIEARDLGVVDAQQLMLLDTNEALVKVIEKAREVDRRRNHLAELRGQVKAIPSQQGRSSLLAACIRLEAEVDISRRVYDRKVYAFERALKEAQALTAERRGKAKGGERNTLQTP